MNFPNLLLQHTLDYVRVILAHAKCTLFCERAEKDRFATGQKNYFFG